MVETITKTSLTNLVNDSSITAAKAEAILIQAINKINQHGYSLDALTGAEGSRTGNYSQAEAGGILDVAVQIYSTYYKSAGASSSSYGLGGLSSGQSSSTGSKPGAVDELARYVANSLQSKSLERV